MKKLRLQFIFFSLLLSTSLGILLFYSYKQMNREEQTLWENIAENVYNQMQARLSGMLTEEDKRSFSEYRYYYIPETQVGKFASLSISPLATMPKNNPVGLIGYFQIDPDGSFHTPYLLNKKRWKRLSDQEDREKLHTRLKDMTHSFQNETIQAQNNPEKIVPQKTIELGTIVFTTKQTIRDASGKTTIKKESRTYTLSSDGLSSGYKNVYPNPLIEKKQHKRRSSLFKKKSKRVTTKKSDKKSDIDKNLMKISNLSRKIETTSAQSQAFQNQLNQGEENEDKKDKTLNKVKNNLQSLGSSIKIQQQSIFVDPFRARLIPNEESVIFYRKVWLDQKLYIQGFVVKIKQMFSWLMDMSFANSDLPDFSLAKLKMRSKTLAMYGSADILEQDSKLLFVRNFGYPLNLFSWQVYAGSLPHMSARVFLNTLAAVIGLILTVGLYLIYRTTKTQVLLSQKRQDFVSAVTHELKTPLTSLRMYSEMLQNNWINDESKKQQYYSFMNQESGRLSRLIDNVLQMARLEKRNYKLTLKTDSPVTDFQRILLEIQNLIENEGFEFSSHIDENISSIEYDDEALKQILFTLVENSLKFSKNSSEKKIHISLKQDKGSVVFTVNDKGPGIPSKHLKKVFEKFYRVENEMTRQTKGTGIGLAMAKMIMQEMHAEIEAVNQRDGGLSIKLIFKAVS